jgi:hypothetical protein
LLDPSLVPATVFGFLDGAARYVGFVRSRIRDATERYVPIKGYVDWTARVAAELKNEKQKRSGVFGRYAQVVDNIDEAEAKPLCVLLDFARDGFVDAQDIEAVMVMGTDPDVDYNDLCADIDDSGGFVIKIGGLDIPCSIEYRADVKKYRLKSDALNERFPPKETQDRRQKRTLVQRLNQEQSFKIIVERNGVIYSEGRFYEPRLRWVTEDGSKPILNNITAARCLGP